MFNGQQHFKGVLAAANFLGAEEGEDGRGFQAEGGSGKQEVLLRDQEELFKQTRLSVDDYLAIPTFIRQGKGFSQPIEA